MTKNISLEDLERILKGYFEKDFTDIHPSGKEHGAAYTSGFRFACQNLRADLNLAAR